MSQPPSDNAVGRKAPITRRRFTQQIAAGTAAAALAPTVLAADDTPAALGGKPLHRGGWPSWPVADESEEAAVTAVARDGDWYRYAGGESTVDQFERQWARAVNAAHCQATNSGTSALITSLAALGIGPGDEVLVPPYTFIATVNAVLLHHALPVFVDSDPATAQIDPSRVADRVNGNTRCILPVHLGGASCDMDQLLAISRRHNLQVVEDACQAHTGEWKSRRLGTLGDAGCFSFQNSKNITSGEGGALVTSNEQLFYRAQAFHNQGRGRFEHDGQFTANGGNFRLTQFQGAVLLEQFQRLEEQSRRREANADYLSSLLNEIEGVAPKRRLDGTTRHGWHLYVFDYEPQAFAGMTKRQFTAALRAEGIPVSGGYGPLNKEQWVERMLASRAFQRVYGPERLKQWRRENHLPANDRMIESTCWLSQTVLLADREDIEQIAAAIRRVQQHASAIARA